MVSTRGTEAGESRHFTTDGRRQRYSTKPEVVEAEVVTKANMAQLARWCGGIVSDDQTDEGIVDFVLVPNVFGRPIKAREGYYLVKYLENGRFSAMPESEFKSKGFEPVGMREGSVHRTTGPGRVMRGAGISPYWDYPDYPSHGSVEPAGWGLNSDAP